MNKSELIDAMAADAGISKASAKKALESFLGSVSSTLQGGGRVSLVGFGSWSVSQRAARLSLIHNRRCRRYSLCRSRSSPYH